MKVASVTTTRVGRCMDGSVATRMTRGTIRQAKLYRVIAIKPTSAPARAAKAITGFLPGTATRALASSREMIRTSKRNSTMSNTVDNPETENFQYVSESNSRANEAQATELSNKRLARTKTSHAARPSKTWFQMAIHK